MMNELASLLGGMAGPIEEASKEKRKYAEKQREESDKAARTQELVRMLTGGDSTGNKFRKTITSDGGLSFTEVPFSEQQKEQVAERSPQLANLTSYIRESVAKGANPAKIMDMTKPERFETSGEQTQVQSALASGKAMSPKQQPDLMKEVRKKELIKAAEALPKLENAEQAVKNLEQQFYRGHTPKSVAKGDIGGGLMAKLTGLGEGASAMMNANPELATYMADKEAFAGLISKGGFGEAGMLTNQDIKRVTNALPSPGDSKETAEIKWREIKSILGSARERYETNMSRYGGKNHGGVSQGTSYNAPGVDKQNVAPGTPSTNLKQKYGLE